jgi:hypothetical protein
MSFMNPKLDLPGTLQIAKFSDHRRELICL